MFIKEDFLLRNKISYDLYNNFAKDMPIIDFHNHLDSREIYEDRIYNDLYEIWLEKDHYKWRAMRTYGIDESYITGDKDNYDKFLAWAETIENSIGNPLYHWTHLELKRYFNIEQELNTKTARYIWDKCNEVIKSREYSVRNLLKMQKVEVICTTDDPIDDLFYHKKLKEEGFEIKVLPTFRPEKALKIEMDNYIDYIKGLEEKTNTKINSIDDLLNSLEIRLKYFISLGCKVSDHSIEDNFKARVSRDELNEILINKLNGRLISKEDEEKYKGYILKELGKLYSKYDLVMQLHIGALRNNSTRLYKNLGQDCGIDSISDMSYSRDLSELLDEMDITDELPKVILYYLNPKDAEMLATMIGNFQSNSKGIKGKLQLGAAWWFCDNKKGIENQLETLALMGLLSTFVGMLTDSRSFLSFTRHEYFRRILCNKIGSIVNDEEFPLDIEYLEKLIKNICYYNPKNYFDFSEVK